jgi:hypothetical protein
MTDYFQNGRTYEGVYVSGHPGKLAVKIFHIHSEGKKMLVEYTSSRNRLDRSEMVIARIETWEDVAQVAFFKTKSGAEVKVYGCREVEA